MDSAPTIPTVAETVPGYEATSWVGLFAPARTPPAIIAKLHEALGKGMRSARVKLKLEGMGYQVSPEEPPEKLRDYVRAKLAETKLLVSRIGLKP